MQKIIDVKRKELLLSAKTVGIAFGGGGARGMAHLGVLKVLEENGIHPDVVSGTSFGSIVGAFYCAGYSWEKMLEIIENTKWHQIIDISLKGGLIKGDNLAKFLKKYLPAKFEDLEKPLSITATNLETASEIIFTKGDLITAIRASSCFPGVFEPVKWEGKYLTDGGLLDNVPVGALYSYAVDRTIAVNVNTADYSIMEDRDEGFWSKVRKTLKITRASLPLEILIKAVDIMQERNSRVNLAINKPDLYIHVELPGVKVFHFDKMDEIVKRGEKTAKALLENE